ncbi:hypothetical protein HDV03_005132 [Kappamyces sp. JEL0829]|nr:hypothetical protein HDV03_005132 [Kappamyces sp. JEL0829]
MAPTQISVFTGFLGAGKTSIITSLLPDLAHEKVFVLKNEFGDNDIDGELIKASAGTSIQVKEMMNGCLCCVLVGQMKTALEEMRAWQIRDMDPAKFHLDSIITVVDCVNFSGYEDTSYTARLQAQYTDLILLNKVELVTERQLDLTLDAVNELNTDTPKLPWYRDRRSVDSSLLFGLDTQLFLNSTSSFINDVQHHEREVDLLHVSQPGGASSISDGKLDAFLATLDKEYVYRVKGIFPVVDGSSAGAAAKVLNWAFGRWEWIDIDDPPAIQAAHQKGMRATMMGVGLAMALPMVQAFFTDAHIQLSKRHAHGH